VQPEVAGQSSQSVVRSVCQSVSLSDGPPDRQLATGHSDENNNCNCPMRTMATAMAMATGRGAHLHGPGESVRQLRRRRWSWNWKWKWPSGAGGERLGEERKGGGSQRRGIEMGAKGRGSGASGEEGAVELY
jgi:hypothetical protein